MNGAMGYGLFLGSSDLPLLVGCSKVYRTAEVCRAGVADIACGVVQVNQDDLIELARQAVDNMMPERDFCGKFAARVTIRVELLGDQSPEIAKRLTADGLKTESKEECNDLPQDDEGEIKR